MIGAASRFPPQKRSGFFSDTWILPGWFGLTWPSAGRSPRSRLSRMSSSRIITSVLNGAERYSPGSALECARRPVVNRVLEITKRSSSGGSLCRATRRACRSARVCVRRRRDSGQLLLRIDNLAVELDADAHARQERLELFVQGASARKGSEAEQETEVDRVMVGIASSLGQDRIVGFEEGAKGQMVGMRELLRLDDDEVQDGDICARRVSPDPCAVKKRRRIESTFVRQVRLVVGNSIITERSGRWRHQPISRRRRMSEGM